MSTFSFGGAGISAPAVVGHIKFYSGTLPDHCLDNDGSAISRSTYADLFAEIGTTFGAGDGSSTFNIPNPQNRFIICSGSTYAIASTGGAATVTMGAANDPIHYHEVRITEASATATDTAGGAFNLYDSNSAGGSTGDGGPHQNLMSYLALGTCIRYEE